MAQEHFDSPDPGEQRRAEFTQIAQAVFSELLKNKEAIWDALRHEVKGFYGNAKDIGTFLELTELAVSAHEVNASTAEWEGWIEQKREELKQLLTRKRDLKGVLEIEQWYVFYILRLGRVDEAIELADRITDGQQRPAMPSPAPETKKSDVDEEAVGVLWNSAAGEDDVPHDEKYRENDATAQRMQASAYFDMYHVARSNILKHIALTLLKEKDVPRAKKAMDGMLLDEKKIDCFTALLGIFIEKNDVTGIKSLMQEATSLQTVLRNSGDTGKIFSADTFLGDVLRRAEAFIQTGKDIQDQLAAEQIDRLNDKYAAFAGLEEEQNIETIADFKNILRDGKLGREEKFNKLYSIVTRAILAEDMPLQELLAYVEQVIQIDREVGSRYEAINTLIQDALLGILPEDDAETRAYVAGASSYEGIVADDVNANPFMSRTQELLRNLATLAAKKQDKAMFVRVLNHPRVSTIGKLEIVSSLVEVLRK